MVNCLSGLHVKQILLSSANELSGAARNHISRRIRWPCNDSRHDGGVSHAQARKAVHAELWVDDREIIHAHLACADGMSEARRAKPGKFAHFLCGSLRAGHDFDLAHTVKGALISKFTRGFDCSHDGRKIVIRAEIVAIDHGGILKVVARQTDGASTRWLHKSRRDREGIVRRRTK